MDKARSREEGFFTATLKTLFIVCIFLKQAIIKSLKVGKQILAQSRLFPELKAIFQTLQSEVFESCLPSTCNKFTVGGTYLQHACLYS